MSFIEINTRSKNIYRGDPKLSANLPIVQNLQKKKKSPWFITITPWPLHFNQKIPKCFKKYINNVKSCKNIIPSLLTISGLGVATPRHSFWFRTIILTRTDSSTTWLLQLMMDYVRRPPRDPYSTHRLLREHKLYWELNSIERESIPWCRFR
jgi:hypothetical protein